jgi:DNA-directed RNA polymerase subunit H
MNHVNEVSKSLTVVSEMLSDRGLAAANLNRLSAAQVAEIIGNHNRFSVLTAEDTIAVVYDLSPKFKWAECKEYIASVASGAGASDLALVILVVREECDIKNIKPVAGSTLDMQVFYLKELQFNKSTHSLVPKHELIADVDEIAGILRACDLAKATMLPLIPKGDAQVKYLNGRPGNLVKVTRISPTCGENVVYRCVV